MSAKNFVIFYVDKPEASAAFYSALLNRPPVESSPTFALFALDSGLMLGLWSRHTVEPAAA
ncbi:drug:proton antiporter, partial [Achromobacter xylosoxidans]